MILSCNSCGKKFVVPDQAISSAGRLVQCGSCGNKWKQFPVSNEIKKTNVIKKIDNLKTENKTLNKKPKKKRAKKSREINLYSPEYLEKKHGISLKKVDLEKNRKESKKISLGFYNSLLIFIVFIIIFSRGLYFFQDFISNNFPFAKFYLDYFFESIKNMFEIWKNLISSY